MKPLTRSLLLGTGFVLVLTSPARPTPIHQIDWMALTPAAFGEAPPTTGYYDLSGVGAVQLAYTADTDYGQARVQNPALSTGSITSDSVTYAWTNHETLGRTLSWSSPWLSSTWEATYTFGQLVPAGQLIVGIQGLGRRDPSDDESPEDVRTSAVLVEGGTYLGDWAGNGNYGPTIAVGDANGLSLMNAMSGPGQANPWWNTGLALIRIDVPVSSLTVRFNQTRGDGVGVNIGSLVPEPASALLLAAGGLFVFRRSCGRSRRGHS